MNPTQWAHFWEAINSQDPSRRSTAWHPASDTDSPDPDNDLELTHTPYFEGVRRGRSNRCGSCKGCRSSDCGSCKNCRDKPRFGGPGIKKKACIARACQRAMRPAFDDHHDSSAVAARDDDSEEESEPVPGESSQLSDVSTEASPGRTPTLWSDAHLCPLSPLRLPVPLMPSRPPLETLSAQKSAAHPTSQTPVCSLSVATHGPGPPRQREVEMLSLIAST